LYLFKNWRWSTDCPLSEKTGRPWSIIASVYCYY